MPNRFPSFSQWRQIPKVLSKKEKIIFGIAALLCIASFAVLAVSLYLSFTQVAPAFGGTYVEGVVGQPHLINPLYDSANSTDSAISQLIFDGLMTYDGQGNVIPDLAQNYQVSADGKTYDFQLRKNLVWQDGSPLTADDIVFTIEAIQNPAYKSPLEADWLDVAVEKTSDTSIRFVLPAPYHSFLENCTVKILPKHIWQNIAPENAALSSYNLQPVGSGPFQFASLTQSNSGFITRLDLQSNRKYFVHPSYLAGISFAFFQNTDDLQKASAAGNINGFAVDSFGNDQKKANQAVAKDVLSKPLLSTYQVQIPRYVAVFFNTQDNSVLGNPNIRKALSDYIDSKQVTQSIAQQTGVASQIADSPILPQFFGYQNPQSPYAFDKSQADALMSQSGFKQNSQGQWVTASNKKPAFQFTQYLKQGSSGTQVIQLQLCLNRLDPAFKNLIANDPSGKYTKNTDQAITLFQQKYLPDSKPTGETGDATRQKLNEVCFTGNQQGNQFSFTLTTVDQPQLVAAAESLKKQWESAGIQVTIQAVSTADMSSVIESRTYDALLYGETLGMQPDLYPFWHSSQKIYPGLNLSSYENSTLDKLLIAARQATDDDSFQQAQAQIQDAILADAPALFLYSPDYAFWVSDTINGIDTIKIADPSKRFINITHWYIKTKRIWK